MKKIPTLFKRDNGLPNNPVLNEVNPGCEWVLAGEGIATHKWDGTCCLLKEGILFKRYDAKEGRVPPEGFVPAQEPDKITGHWPGWLRVTDKPEDKYFVQGLQHATAAAGGALPDGTYELIGPKINGNKDRVDEHTLINHGKGVYADFPRTFEGVRTFLETFEGEGVVFHHPDGRMCKIKRRDFGLKW